MGFNKISEPYVKVTEKVRDFPALLNIDSLSNIAGVITAPTGPRLAIVNGPKDLIEKYTIGGVIPRNASTSFLNAYYLSFSTSLVIARSLNTSTVGALYFHKLSKTVTTVYVNSPVGSVWGLKVEDKYYFKCPSGKWSDFLATINSDQAKDEAEREYSVQSSDLEEIKKYTEDQVVYCRNFAALSNNLTKVGDQGEVTRSSIYDSDHKCVVLTGDSLEDTNISQPVNFTHSTTSKSEDVIVGDKINYKDGTPLNLSKEITLDLTGGNFKLTPYILTFGGSVYYSGAVTKLDTVDGSQYKLSSIVELVNSISNMPGLNAYITKGSDEDKSVTIKVEYSAGNQPELTAIEGLTITPKDEVDKYKGITTYFSVYVPNPEESDLYTITISPYDDSKFKLEFKDGSDTQSYLTSLNVDEVDDYGNNCYIENLNSYTDKFKIEVNNQLTEEDLTGFKVTTKVATKFGDSGVSRAASELISNKIAALELLGNQEMYDIDAYAPLGETNLRFVKSYVSLGSSNYWFTPVDTPYNLTNVSSIKGYFMNVPRGSNVMAMGPFDKNTGLTGWTFYLAASTLYYQRLMLNRAMGKEFVGAFESNGVLQYTNPTVILGKLDRTELLNFSAPINFVSYSRRLDSYYLNNNLTFQVSDNVLSEDMNRRCLNKINLDFKNLMKGFKGRFNTRSTRDDVISLGRLYFRNTITNQQSTCVEDYQIICDESNNPVSVINARKLAVTVKVKFRNSSKYIDVVTDVYPIGVDFES